MEEAGILENPALLSLVIPNFEPGPKMAVLGMFFEHPYTDVNGVGKRD
jgi:hypothetical protein